MLKAVQTETYYSTVEQVWFVDSWYWNRGSMHLRRGYGVNLDTAIIRYIGDVFS